MNRKSRAAAIFFRGSNWTCESCHKNANDHALEARVHPASLPVVVVWSLPHGIDTPESSVAA